MSAPSPVAALRRLAGTMASPEEIARSTLHMLLGGHRTFLGNGNAEDKEFPKLTRNLHRQAHNHVSWIEFAEEQALLRVVKFCLKNGVAVDDIVEGDTLSSRAAQYNRLPLLQFLLDRDASPNGPVLPEEDRFPCSPLQSAMSWAKKNDSTAGIELLLDRGANPNQVNHYGQTVLFDVVSWCRLDLANLLTSRGADPLLLDFNKNTLLHDFASNSGDSMNEEAVEWMIKKGVDPHQPNGEGEDAFELYSANLSETHGPIMVQALHRMYAEHQANQIDQSSQKALSRRKGSGLRL